MTNQTRIKICGICSASDADKIRDVWAAGIILHNYSPRSVSLKAAQEIHQALDENISLCGVFCDTPIDRLVAKTESIGLDIIQLHGEEDQDYCDQVRQRTGLPIIKAGAVQSQSEATRLFGYAADYHLFDGDKRDTLPFDWQWVKRRGQQKKVVIAGHLNSQNVGQAIAAARPYAVDVVRGTEKRSGVKSSQRIKDFISAVQEADQRYNDKALMLED